MDWISDEHRRRNRTTREAWELYAGHRRRVAELLARSGTRRGRLCLLGAGNCNDLDLDRLADAFTEVHLVDLDADALAEGVARQAPRASERIVRHAPVDVTGVAARLSAWNDHRRPSNDEALDCVRAAEAAPAPELPGPFDAVASVGLLTQLINSAQLALGGEHPQLVPLIIAIRHRHARLMLELLRPGGEGLLVSEIVSSDTAPELAVVDESQLPELATRLIQSRNFFTGCNPFALQALFQNDSDLAPLVAQVQLLRPWRWQFVNRVYAVSGLQFERKA
jgi:hypothetical protein